MTAAELIELLEDAPPTAEVRLATQPAWPLAFQVGTVTPDGVAGGCDEPGCEDCSTEAVVWIAAGDHPEDSPYAPSDVF